MGTDPTRALQGPRATPRRPRTAASSRDLPIEHPEGHQRYLGRPLDFGPIGPDDLAAFCRLRAQLAQAQAEGNEALLETLARYSIGSREQWWHIEASFYQRHPLAKGARLGRDGVARRRRADGTPAPTLITQRVLTVRDMPTEPVPFEAFCELAGAQAAWTSAGLDPKLEASNYFLLEPDELAVAELYWTDRLAADRKLARRFARRMLEYKEQFLAE